MPADDTDKMILFIHRISLFSKVLYIIVKIKYFVACYDKVYQAHQMYLKLLPVTA